MTIRFSQRTKLNVRSNSNVLIRPRLKHLSIDLHAWWYIAQFIIVYHVYFSMISLTLLGSCVDHVYNKSFVLLACRRSRLNWVVLPRKPCKTRPRIITRMNW